MRAGIVSRVVVAALALALTVSSSATSSAAPTTTDDSHTNSYPRLAHVDCVSTTLCLAVGAHFFLTTPSDSPTAYYFDGETVPLVETWDGRTWHETPFPAVPHLAGSRGVTEAQLDSIACTPLRGRTAATMADVYCLALGSYYSVPYADLYQTDDEGPLTAIWNGTRWRLADPPTACEVYCSRRSDAVCTSPHTCFALGSLGDGAGAHPPVEHEQFATWTWNGSVWHHASITGQARGLSCWADDGCLVVGDTHPQNHPTRHTQGPFTFVPGTYDAVDCHDAGYCVALSPDTSLTRKPSGSVVSRLLDPSTQQLSALACPQRGFCLATGSARSGHQTPTTEIRRVAQKLLGIQWHQTASPGRTSEPPTGAFGPFSDGLLDVSCAAPGLCFAIGGLYSRAADNSAGTVQDRPGDVAGAGLVVRFDGHGWADVPVEVTPYDGPRASRRSLRPPSGSAGRRPRRGALGVATAGADARRGHGVAETTRDTGRVRCFDRWS